eukprot:4775120-Lingulodinium_polyedra.AAC.1
MSHCPDHTALASLLPFEQLQRPLPPARSCVWWACRAAWHRVVPGFNPKRATPASVWRLLHQSPPPRG